MLYVVGRKALGYFSFPSARRRRVVDRLLPGASGYANAKIAETLVTAFMAGADDEGDGPGADGILGRRRTAHRLYRVQSMLSQTAEPVRIAPLAVSTSGNADRPDPVSFEPSADVLFDALLPRYVATRVFAALLEGRGLGVGFAATRHEVGNGQRRRPDQGPDPEANRGARPRSPRKSAKSSVAPTRSPTRKRPRKP